MRATIAISVTEQNFTLNIMLLPTVICISYRDISGVGPGDYHSRLFFILDVLNNRMPRVEVTHVHLRPATTAQTV